MEDRINRLENDMANLRVQHAQFDGALVGLTKVVDELRVVVQDLRDTMNRGRGIVWVFGTGAAAAGGLVSIILEKVLK